MSMSNLVIQNNFCYAPCMVKEVFSLSLDEIKNRLYGFATLSTACKYELGCLLLRVKTEELWRHKEFCNKAEEYKSFNTWIFGEIGITDRMARYMLAVTEKFYEFNVSVEMISFFLEIGWAKTYHILRIARKRDDLQEWIEKVKSLSEREVIGMVRAEIARRSKRDSHDLDILPQSVKLTISIRKQSDLGFFNKARALAEKRTGVSSLDGFLLLLCAQYIATSGDASGMVLEAEEHIAALEKMYGIKLSVDPAIAE